MSKSKSRKFADILSGNLATVLDDGIISASEVASLGTAATTDATAYATEAQGTTADNALPKAGGAMTGAITTNSTFDGRDIATDGAKLDAIETGATADQTAAQILTAIKTVDGASSGLDADLLDGQQGSYYTNYADTAIANLTDSAPSTLNTLNELAAALGDDASFSTTVTNSIATKLPLAGGTMTGDVLYGDNVKAKFGAGSDLQIYHDGSNSYITDNGTGDLIIRGTTKVKLQSATGTTYFEGTNGSEVRIKFNNSTKLKTTSTGINVIGNVVLSGTVDGRDIATDGTKLDTIETNATADQTDAEIRAAVEAATDSNVFTNADHTKLNSIEDSADVTDTANVVSALTAGTNIAISANGTISSTDTNTTYSVQDGELSQNNFTDADHTKLNSIETNADVTDTTNVVAALTAGTNVSIAANGTISSTDTNTTYSVGDGGLTQKNFTTTLKSKLDGIESGATADQSASEISGLEEFVEDQIGANIIGGTNVSVSYNDTTGQTTLSSTDTNTTYSAGSGLGLSGTTFSHTDTSSQASVNNSGRTYIQDITLDTYGHITAISSATETVVNTDTTYSVGDGGLTQNNFTNADHTKLNGIEANADVTDPTNVAAAGAMMANVGAIPSVTDTYDCGNYNYKWRDVYASGSVVAVDGEFLWVTTDNDATIGGNVVVTGTVDGRDVATDGAKLDGIATSANNYSHPNHTGEVTGSSYLTIANNVVDEANLKVSNTPTNGYFLSAQSGNTGGLTWAAAGGGANVQTFTSSGTWNKPSSGTVAMITCIGGGGGGARNNGNINSQSGGGSVTQIFKLLSHLSSSITVTIGAGGAFSFVAVGGAGGNTKFGTDAIAVGGRSAEGYWNGNWYAVQYPSATSDFSSNFHSNYVAGKSTLIRQFGATGKLTVDVGSGEDDVIGSGNNVAHSTQYDRFFSGHGTGAYSGYNTTSPVGYGVGGTTIHTGHAVATNGTSGFCSVIVF